MVTTNYQADFLKKIEVMILSVGGTVPAMSNATNFEERSLELLDSLNTSLQSLNTSLQNIGSPEQVDLFGDAPTDDSILTLNTVSGQYEHSVLEGCSLALPADFVLGAGDNGTHVKIAGWTVYQDISGGMSPDANGEITLPKTGRYLVGGFARVQAQSPTPVGVVHVVHSLMINGGALAYGDAYLEDQLTIVHATGFAFLYEFSAGTRLGLSVYFATSTGNYTHYTLKSPRVLANARFFCYLMP